MDAMNRENKDMVVINGMKFENFMDAYAFMEEQKRNMDKKRLELEVERKERERAKKMEEERKRKLEEEKKKDAMRKELLRLYEDLNNAQRKVDDIATIISAREKAFRYTYGIDSMLENANKNLHSNKKSKNVHVHEYEDSITSFSDFMNMLIKELA